MVKHSNEGHWKELVVELGNLSGIYDQIVNSSPRNTENCQSMWNNLNSTERRADVFSADVTVTQGVRYGSERGSRLGSFFLTENNGDRARVRVQTIDLVLLLDLYTHFLKR